MRLLSGVRLSDRSIELRWWWEAPPPGEPVAVPDVCTARLLLASIGARPEHSPALRRFLAEGEPWPAAPLDHADLVEQLAVALAAGKVRMAKVPVEPLGAWDGEPEEQALAERVTSAAQPVPEQEDICWPCLLRAAASSRALREAASGGAPYIVEG
jgi:hypothetical protein